MRKILTALLFSTMLVQLGFSQTSNVKWLSFEEALEKSKSEKRPIFIDVYTDWCGWCKKMDAATFSNPEVAKVLNSEFYAVKLNAEQKGNIQFNGKTFKWVDSGRNGYHELAAALLNGKMSYPTVVFLDENFNMIQPLAGYLDAPTFHPIVKYIGGSHYKKTKWEEYKTTAYKSPFN